MLIDEFQDFNKMEAGVIELLAERNSIVIAGDDDQALYSQLRAASWDHIRAHYLRGHYEIFELPFCMRCPEVVVGAVNDVIAKAREIKKFDGRIEKPYRYYEPIKGDDSRRFPHIELVETTVQRENANYFGRYIEKCIRAIPEADTESAKKAMSQWPSSSAAILIVGRSKSILRRWDCSRRMRTADAAGRDRRHPPRRQVRLLHARRRGHRGH